MIFINKYYGLILVLILSFWAIKPLFVNGFFPMHDDTQVARVFEMGKALRDGMFPVRWVPDLGYGYGYPIFNFYAPLSYYFGGFLTLLGFDALLATKIMMAVGILLSGVFMYLLAREFWGVLGGILSGLFYVYAPYHALDIYVRGDVAEFWAYAFVPLMFWGFYKVFKDPRWKWVIVGSLGYAGIILSHNLTAMMVTPFLAIVTLLYCYIAYRNKKLFTIYYLLFTILLGLMISAFYWIPALLEMKYTNVLSQIGGGADFRDHFVCIRQLWDSHWGFGGSASGCIDGLSFKIGKLHIILSLISIISAILFLRKRREKIWLIVLLSIGFILSVFLTLEISRPIWEALPLVEFLQYPWRFLLIASFFASLLCGVIFLKLDRKIKYVVIISVVFLLIFFNSRIFNPQTIFSRVALDYTNEKYLRWTISKISDEYLPRDFVKPNNKDEVPNAIIVPELCDSKIAIESLKTHSIRIITNQTDDTNFLINIAYFPAWKIFVDGKEKPFKVLNSRISIHIPSGKHKIDLKFQETLLEKTSNAISLLGISMIIIGIIKFRSKVNK